VRRGEKLSPERDYRLLGARWYAQGLYVKDTKLGAQIAARELYAVEEGDFVYNRLFAWKGSFAVASAEHHGCYVSNEFPCFRVNRDKAEPDYLWYYFSRASAWDEALGLSTGGTPTSRNRLKEAKLLAMRVPLPPIGEQRRILACVKNLSSKLSAAGYLQRQTIEAAASLSSASSDTAYEALKKEYGTEQVGSLCISVSDGDHNTPQFSEVGVKFVFVGNVSSGYFHFEDSKFVTPEYFAAIRSQRVPKRGDILYSAVGATLGVPAVVDTDEQFCFQRHVAIIKPNPSLLDSRFCWHMLRSRIVNKSAWSKTTGTAQPTIPLRGIKSLEMPVPPLAEQRSVALSLDEVNAKADQLKKLQAESASELNALLPSILDRAFKGEL
jgi:type I restriction enzyme S subunit